MGFMAKAESLILDGSLREKLGEAGRRYMLENCFSWNWSRGAYRVVWVGDI